MSICQWLSRGNIRVGVDKLEDISQSPGGWYKRRGNDVPDSRSWPASGELVQFCDHWPLCELAAMLSGD